MSQATERAAMPKGTHAALEHRTVFNANQNLLPIIKPGDHILDVGCGSGSITASIAALVGNTGSVTGIDTSEHLITLARENYASLNNVHFEIADILQYTAAVQYDIVTAARVLQWVENPKAILQQMTALVKRDGYITVLDYNHEKIQWSPAVPTSMNTFYKAFLQWRKDAGMNNQLADHLADMFCAAGLHNITVTDHAEIAKSIDPDFSSRINIWTIVANTRGKQMVQDGFLTEIERAAAEEDYRYWAITNAQTMHMYLFAVTGQK